MGTPELARTVLRRLAAEPRWEIGLVVSQPDKPVGRGLETQPTPVKQEALACNLPLAQPTKARDPLFLDQLRQLKPEVIIVAAYGQLLPAASRFRPAVALTSTPQSFRVGARGCTYSMGRGAIPRLESPLMLANAGLDTGPIAAQRKVSILETDTGASLHDRLAELGGSLVVSPFRLAGRQTGDTAPAGRRVTVARKPTRGWPHRLGRPACPPRNPRVQPWPRRSPISEPQRTPHLLKIWEVNGSPRARLPEPFSAVDDRLIVSAGRGAGDQNAPA
jgi:methionyl-tRNA formyltransferase